MEHLPIEPPPTKRRKLSLLKMASWTGGATGAILLVFVLTLLFFPDPLVNRFVKPRLSRALAEAYPAYSIRIAAMTYSPLKNRFGFDSVALSGAGGPFSSTIGSLSVSGIDWIHLLWGGTLAPADFAGSVVSAQDIVLNFTEAQYVLRCEFIRVSVPDSEIRADALTFLPALDDQHFFAESRFRKTRFNLATQQVRLTGVACLEALARKHFRGQCIHIQDMVLDVLINKDKPSIKDSSAPSMPNDILRLTKETLQCDSLNIINGALKYGERFDLASKPAMITFDSMRVEVNRTAAQGGADDTVVIRAHGEFMKAGAAAIFMSIPVSSPEFSFRYSGSLRAMDLRALNPFIEIAEQQRVKSGMLQSASFAINVIAGRAGGSVHAVYRDLSLVAINKHTGSENGFVDGIASYFARTYKIRGTNVPDKAGAMKIGIVSYLRRQDDPFFRFWWFALRSGVGNVVGF